MGKNKIIDYFFSALGNGTSLRGIAEPLIKDNPLVKIMGVRYLNPENSKSINMAGGDNINLPFPHLEVIVLHKTIFIPLSEIKNYAAKNNLGLTSAAVKLAVEKHILESGIKDKVFFTLFLCNHFFKFLIA